MSVDPIRLTHVMSCQLIQLTPFIHQFYFILPHLESFIPSCIHLSIHSVISYQSHIPRLLMQSYLQPLNHSISSHFIYSFILLVSFHVMSFDHSFHIITVINFTITFTINLTLSFANHPVKLQFNSVTYKGGPAGGAFAIKESRGNRKHRFPFTLKAKVFWGTCGGSHYFSSLFR